MAFVREGNAERGFTLIELMIVVAIVAILAIVVVPSFMSSATKSKARTETAAMFSEIATKQGQFYAEQQRFLGQMSSAPNFDGTTTCPSAVPAANYVFKTSCITNGSAWERLRIVPSESALRCQYTMTAGLAGTTFTPPTGFKNSQGVLGAAEPALSSSWFYLHARCNNTGDTGFSEYYQSSIDRKIQARNEGL